MAGLCVSMFVCGCRKEDQYEGQWIMSHVDTASFQLGKPVLVEEFGKKLSVNRLNPSSIRVVRDPVFRSVYRMVENLIADGHAIGGSMFWRLDLPMFHDSDRSEALSLFSCMPLTELSALQIECLPTKLMIS